MSNRSTERSRRLTLRIPENPGRLDRTLAHELRGRHSRSEIVRWIREGLLLLNGRSAKPATEVCEGDLVEILIPEPLPSDLEPENLSVPIVYEDEHLAVVDKPAGMVTHPAGALRSGTLVNALLYQIQDLSGVGGVLRPGIVHRLDKGTSGLLVVAKHDEAHRRLAAQLKARTLRRIYEAVVWGCVTPGSFSVDAPIARHPRDRKRMAVVARGKEARSHVRVLWASELASHLEVRLETGRTHQIRVHLQHRGHPLVGDSQYGGRRRALRSQAAPVRRLADELIQRIERPALHARRLELIHPFEEDVRVFESLPPADFRGLVEALRGVEFPRISKIG